MVKNYQLKNKFFLALYCLVATHGAENLRNQNFPLKFMNSIIIVEQTVKQQKNLIGHLKNNSVTEDTMNIKIYHSMTYSTECKFLSQIDASN